MIFSKLAPEILHKILVLLDPPTLIALEESHPVIAKKIQCDSLLWYTLLPEHLKAFTVKELGLGQDSKWQLGLPFKEGVPYREAILQRLHFPARCWYCLDYLYDDDHCSVGAIGECPQCGVDEPEETPPCFSLDGRGCSCAADILKEVLPHGELPATKLEAVQLAVWRIWGSMAGPDLPYGVLAQVPRMLQYLECHHEPGCYPWQEYLQPEPDDSEGLVSSEEILCITGKLMSASEQTWECAVAAWHMTRLHAWLDEGLPDLDECSDDPYVDDFNKSRFQNIREAIMEGGPPSRWGAAYKAFIIECASCCPIGDCKLPGRYGLQQAVIHMMEDHLDYALTGDWYVWA